MKALLAIHYQIRKIGLAVIYIAKNVTNTIKSILIIISTILINTLRFISLISPAIIVIAAFSFYGPTIALAMLLILIFIK